MTLLAASIIAVLFGAGVHLMLRRDAVKIAAGSILTTNSAILLIISAGFRAHEAPIHPVADAARTSDPLAQALALTAIAIGFAVTAVVLRVALEVEQSHQTIDMNDLVRAERAEEQRRAKEGA